MVVQANVAGRDLATVVDELRGRVNGAVKLPEGYHIEYGGQFESAAQATRNLILLSVIVVIGGVLAVALTSGVISVASLVGFITLFGIATRNGIMMVTHFEHLMIEDGRPLPEAVVQGSLERLAPILMTALCAGLALVPLVIAGGEAGNEIQAPMGVVILGGLLSSTFLNMLVLPVLFRRFGTPPALSRRAP
jgi:Cu/Ag efflux pump CusA